MSGTVREIFEAGAARAEEGEGFRLLPGLPREEIEVFERTLPGPLPTDISALLEFSAGFEREDGPVRYLDFRGHD